MLKKLAGYSLISILSFTVFFLCLHTAANAQGSESGIFAPLLAKTKQPGSPTPPPPIAVMIPTKAPSDPSPTTPEATPTPTTAPTSAPTTAPTATPTIAPTATPAATETPTPTTTPGTQPSGTDLDNWFTKYANDYGVDRTLLHDIAKCESHFNTNADTNPPYVGMYQFDPTTWSSTRTSMGLDPNPDLRRNAEEAIKTAAYKIKNGGASAWPPPTCS